MSTENERLHILDMVNNQQISVEQAVELLASISDELDIEETPQLNAAVPVQISSNGSHVVGVSAQASDGPESLVALEQVVYPLDEEQEPVVEDFPKEPSHGPSFDPAQSRWRNWWWAPMGVGIAITVCGALFMYLAWQASGLGFWFVAACLPFLLGVTFMGLAWASRKSRWLHVRIQQPPGESPQRIAISLPMPLRPLAWMVRILRPYIPQLRRTGLDELILALETHSDGQPIYIEVNEGEDGEHVEIYFG